MSTTKATPFLEQILHLVVLFLKKNGYKAEAKTISKNFTVPHWVMNDNPLFEKGLVKIIKNFVKGNQKIQQYYENREAESEQQDQMDESQNQNKKQEKSKLKQKSPKNAHLKPNSPKTRLRSASPKVNASSTWMSKFSQPKKLEDINNHKPAKEEPVKAEVKPAKKQKAKKVEKIQSSDYESDQDSFELEPQKKTKKDRKVQKIEEKKKQASKNIKEKSKMISEEIEVKQIYQNKQREQQKKNSTPGYKQSFSRINKDEVGPIRSELRDNSFHAKGRYGEASDQWGNFGFDKLKDARGDSFKKTKGKLKNKAFQGNLMDINKINSIPIL